MSAMSEITGVLSDIEKHLRPKSTFSKNSEIYKSGVDEKVLEYMWRATEIEAKFTRDKAIHKTFDNYQVSIIEIAKMIQFEEAQ